VTPAGRPGPRRRMQCGYRIPLHARTRISQVWHRGLPPCFLAPPASLFSTCPKAHAIRKNIDRSFAHNRALRVASVRRIPACATPSADVQPSLLRVRPWHNPVARARQPMNRLRIIHPIGLLFFRNADRSVDEIGETNRQLSPLPTPPRQEPVCPGTEMQRAPEQPLPQVGRPEPRRGRPHPPAPGTGTTGPRGTPDRGRARLCSVQVKT
jgi:hypothetical protein